MATYSFPLPDIGEGIAEVEIVAWHAKPGDRVKQGDPLADVLTDKATVELEAPVDGTILQLAASAGDKLAIGSVLATFETESDAPPPENETVEGPADAAEETGRVSRQASSQGGALTNSPAADTVRVQAAPAVRERARALGVNLAVVPTRDGRVRHADLDTYLSSRAAGTDSLPPPSAAAADRTIPIIGVRRRIAEKMAAAHSHIPHFAYVEECDVTALMEMRGQLNAHRGTRPELTILPFLITAMCKALREFPMLNAHYDDEADVVTSLGRVHMGMATQTDAGLTVPVIRDAQDLDLWQLATEIARLAEAARANRATKEELSGSTITISSLGRLGGIAATPIINRPEVAIVAPNRIIERPAFSGESIVRAKVMNLSISCDHRVIDGWYAASFVQAIKHLLETPILLFQP